MRKSRLPRLGSPWLLLVSCATFAAFAFSHLHGSADAAQRGGGNRRQLSLIDRIGYQRAIEKVYWRHQIWPDSNSNSKPSFDQVVSPAQLEKKVGDYLRNSLALEDYWQRPIESKQLQAEMERMARQSKQSATLRELFDALGNDPFVIAECLARPILAERLATSFFAYDSRFHGELKGRAEVDLRTHPSVKELKETSGRYHEIGWEKENKERGSVDRRDETGIAISKGDWADALKTLEATTGDVEPGNIGRLQEDAQRFYATALIEKTDDHVKLATIEWPKEAFESWRDRAEPAVAKAMLAPIADYSLPKLSETINAPTDNTWTATKSTFADRYGHAAIWTGTEVIVWGGNDGSGESTGARYDPATDTWTTASSVNAPVSGSTAIWTGNEMIVWSGGSNAGGRYDPLTDSWTPISTFNAPTARSSHTAVWTGSEMIVWGGNDGLDTNTGGRYNPATDTWTCDEHL